MQNSPINNTFAFDDDFAEHELIAPGDPARLLLTGLLFLLTVVIILFRIFWVQTVLPDRFRSHLEAMTTEYELIPARDGRILAEDRVLAVDVEQYAIQVHYRWLQEPPDSGWISRHVRQRLSREERRNPELVARIEQSLLQERRQLWEHLALRTGLSSHELEARRSRIQQQVEGIAESVNRRHNAGVRENLDGGRGPDAAHDVKPGLLMRAASAVRRALTTTPARTSDQTIVVREQETWHTIASHVGMQLAAMVSEHPEQFPGTRIVSTTQRSYPEHRLAAHLIGARTTLSDHELSAEQESEAARVPASASRKGRFGVEMQYEQKLRGVPGLIRTVRNRRQQVVSSEVTRQPQSGRDVSLTIDVRLQQLCEQLLAESLTDAPQNLLSGNSRSVDIETQTSEQSDQNMQQAAPPQPVPVGGSIIVMEAASGRILAAVSAPGFDLTMFTEGTREAWDAVNADHRRPFISRFSSMALPPGSTFKTVTAIAGLQSEVIDFGSSFHCQGFLRTPDEHRCLIFRHFGRGHGPVNLKQALAESCNVYFFDAAHRMGIVPLNDWTQRLGFGQPTGIDLPFEKPGTILRILPPGTDTTDAASANSAFAAATGNLSAASPDRRYQREALGLSIGQSRLTVTPLQMARMMAAIANGGWLVTPHVVTDEGVSHRASEMSLIHEPPNLFPRVRPGELQEEVIHAVREGLIAAVEEPYGTGYKTVRLNHVRIAGKTGTAETTPGKPDHAWFTGFAPADDPQYVFVVVLEHGGSGSYAAGPIAREIIRWLFPAGDQQQMSARDPEPQDSW